MRRMMGYTIIDDFRLDGPHGFLSNFYESPYRLRGVRYRSVEHHYQAAKTDDRGWIQDIIKAPTAREAKRLGRKAPITPDWERRKIEVMRFALSCKFPHDGDHLSEKLMTTGSAILIEGNTWGDETWGMVARFGAWQGQNLLGILLMERRAILQNLR